MEWKNGEIAEEPLTIIVANDPIICVICEGGQLPW
jgi:hypothetical protein